MASNKPNRTCIICKKAYRYCGNCNGDANKPTWYSIFDSENCHNIYTILTNYRDKIIDVKTAKAELDKCDLSDLEEFPDSSKAQIAEINESVNKAVDNKVDTVKTVVNTDKASDNKPNNKPNYFKASNKVNK